MPAEPAFLPYDAIARKWCDLAQRRRAHLVELYDSGRWKHYYGEAQFLSHLREAVVAVEIWKRIAGFEEGARAPP